VLKHTNSVTVVFLAMDGNEIDINKSLLNS
jgi:hypothetical protein